MIYGITIKHSGKGDNMVDKLNFIYNKSGYKEELEKIKDNQKHLFELNGGDSEALKIVQRHHEEYKKMIYENLEYVMLEILLTERALQELREEFKRDNCARK